MNRGFNISTLIFFLGSFSTQAQVFETPDLEPNPFHSQFYKSVRADYHFNALSGHLNFPFARDFYTGQYLEDELILQNEKRLQDMNQIGYETRGGVSFLMTPKTISPSKVKQSYSSLGVKSVLGAMYTPDAWKILMRGNGPYAGQVMDLAKTGFRNMQWLEFSYGERIKNQSNNNILHWGVNALMLNRYQSLYIKDGHLITDAGGTSIDVMAVGNREQMHGPGLGITADFSYSYLFGSKQVMQLYAQDVGVSFLGTQRYEIDTAFIFTGFYIADPAGIATGELWENKTDSLMEGLTGKKATPKPTVMPAKVGIQYLFTLNEKQGISCDISYRYMSFALPRFLIAHHLLVREALSVKSTIGYGGWGGVQWNESLTFHGKKASLLIEFGGIQSMISDKMPFQITGRTGLFVRI